MITVDIKINAPVDECWKIWTTAADIAQWNRPDNNWHSPKVEIDLKESGAFFFRMETKDGRFGFDHSGKYDRIITNQLIEYTGTDGRKSIVVFSSEGDETIITETFEPDAETPLDLQKDFCNGVLNIFRSYTENKINRS